MRNTPSKDRTNVGTIINRNTISIFATPVAAAVLWLAPSAGFAQQAEEKLPKFTRESTVVKVAPGKWTGPRLADGQPDVQGHWSNTISNHSNLTDPQGGQPGENRRPSKPREERAPSRVSDPADGQVPFLPWARAKQQELLANFPNPVKPEYIEPFARCAPGGPTKSFLWHGNEIRQYPGYVLFLFDSGYRLIHLDGKPHLPQDIKLWNADSRGHWEGNTLVVDVSNNNGKARLGRSGEFFSENTHIAERYVFDNSRERLLYEAVYTDPTVFSRPWTITVPLRRVEKFAYDDWNNFLKPAKLAAGTKQGKEPILEAYERQCVENNGGFGNGAVR
jgi:hypothetical protein